MKKLLYTFLLLFSLSLVFVSCREEKKTPEEKIEQAINDVGDDLEDATDDVKDAVEDVKD